MKELKTIKVEWFGDIPENFTGIAINKGNSKCWYLNGQRHREDGPAIEWYDGHKEWWLNGIYHPSKKTLEATLERWQKKTRQETIDVNKTEIQTINVESIDDVPKNFTGIAKFATGLKAWYLNGKLHRVDGPAVEFVDGYKEWFLNGKYYSETEWEVAVEKLKKPAEKKVMEETLKKVLKLIHVRCSKDIPENFTGIAEYSNRTKEWYLNGVWHRADGPAIEYADGSKFWFLNGKKYSETEWEVAVENLESKQSEKVSEVSTIESFKKTAVSDAKSVAQRIAAIKIAELVQSTLVSLFTSHVKNKKQKNNLGLELSKFFASENGQIVIKSAIGMMAPMFKEQIPEKYQDIFERISTELRIQAETSASTQILETFSSVFANSLQIFIGEASSSPMKIRVAPTNETFSFSQNNEELDNDIAKTSMLKISSF